jgi:hypothetical protein
MKEDSPMVTKRWLTPMEREREHRERVRACIEKAYGRRVNDLELDQGWIDFRAHYYLMQDRLGGINDGSDAGDDDIDVPVH